MRCSRRGRQFRPLTLALQLRRRRPRVRSLERWRQLMRRPVHSYRPEEHLSRNSNLWEQTLVYGAIEQAFAGLAGVGLGTPEGAADLFMTFASLRNQGGLRQYRWCIDGTRSGAILTQRERMA